MKICIFDADAAVRNIFDAALPAHERIYSDKPVSVEELQKHADADVVSFFVTSAFRQEHIDLMPHLKLIVARSTGVDHIDAEYAKSKGITVKNVAKYGAHTVAEFTFALLLTLSRRTFDAFHLVREEGRFETMKMEGFDLYGKTLGVIGTGAIGRNVVSIAKGFGMHVRMFDMYPDTTLESDTVRYVSLEELLRSADIVTLHVPYTKENHHLLNAERFALMKKGAYVINTARGELIDTTALVDALTTGTVAGAGLDVLEEERALKNEAALIQQIDSVESLKTLVRDHVLIDMPRVIITPHIAFNSREAYQEILTTSVQHIVEFAAHA